MSKSLARMMGQARRDAYLTVLCGTGHAPGLIFRPGQDDDSVENLDVRNMRTVVEEALWVESVVRMEETRERGQRERTHLCGVPVGV